MGNAITDIDQFHAAPNPELVEFYIQTRNTVDATDTIAITLTDFGIHAEGLLAVTGWVHTTTGSVITLESVTTSVTTGTLTITIPGGTDDDVRVVKIAGLPNAIVAT